MGGTGDLKWESIYVGYSAIVIFVCIAISLIGATIVLANLRGGFANIAAREDMNNGMYSPVRRFER